MLLFKRLLIPSQLHLRCLVAISEGQGHIRIISVWVLPELTCPALPIEFPPVRKQMSDQELLVYFFAEYEVCRLVEVLYHYFIGFVLRLLVYLVYAVNDPLKLCLS